MWIEVSSNMRLFEWAKRQQAKLKWLWEEDWLHPATFTIRSLAPHEVKILGPSHFAVRGGPAPQMAVKLAHGPMVTSVSDMMLSQREFTWGDYGYYPVYFDITRDAWRAVWPLPLWALHIIGHWMFMRLVGLHRRHWLYHRVPISMQPRIRDLRPCLPRNWRRPPLA